MMSSKSEDEVAREGTEPRSRAHKKRPYLKKKSAQNDSRGNR